LGIILQNSALSFAGHIFVDTDNYSLAEKAFAATINFFDSSGFEISEQGKIKQGSWFKEKVVYKIRNVFRSKEIKELFEKTKKAIELQQIEVHQSEVNKNNAEAASALLTAVKDVPFFATKMGSLVIVKITDADGQQQVIVRLLTTEETIFYDKNPSLLNNPVELLNNLNQGQSRALT
jgi:hypothetical protein